MYSSSRLIKFLFLIFIFGMSSEVNSQIDTAGWYTNMEEERQEAIQSLWQSDRQPILAEDTTHLNYFEPDIQYRRPCSLIKTPDSKPFEISTYSGLVRSYKTYGKVIIPFGEKDITLELYQNEALSKKSHYEDYLFLPFKDLTNGNATYGGGRYLNLKISELEEKGCVIDFNKAYNPWCAYRDGFNCPIPPSANHLQVAINAGEKMFNKPRD